MLSFIVFALCTFQVLTAKDFNARAGWLCATIANLTLSL